MNYVNDVWGFVNQPVFLVIAMIIFYWIKSRKKQEEKDEKELEEKVDTTYCMRRKEKTEKFRERIGVEVANNSEAILAFKSAMIAIVTKLGYNPNDFGLMR